MEHNLRTGSTHRAVCVWVLEKQVPQTSNRSGFPTDYRQPTADSRTPKREIGTRVHFSLRPRRASPHCPSLVGILLPYPCLCLQLVVVAAFVALVLVMRYVNGVVVCVFYFFGVPFCDIENKEPKKVSSKTFYQSAIFCPRTDGNTYRYRVYGGKERGERGSRAHVSVISRRPSRMTSVSFFLYFCRCQVSKKLVNKNFSHFSQL